MYRISKRFGFSASHVLHGLGDDHPCSRLHGHNYEVEVLAAAPELDERGFVVDFRELDGVKAHIDATLDHRHLNDVLDGQPSAEAIARHLYDWCKANLPVPVAERVTAVRAWETPRAYAEYEG
ncbi:MAG: 6-carboxytetrahydropterin synthase [Actinomycetota bacterium]|nr:6-carboxytetrahydropterin synthase [Acidimicrobiia bacterium]MDQ3293489.1 6-carboxytetrahydropterin synthase [Actinomycetota bacterium]